MRGEMVVRMWLRRAARKKRRGYSAEVERAMATIRRMCICRVQLLLLLGRGWKTGGMWGWKRIALQACWRCMTCWGEGMGQLLKNRCARRVVLCPGIGLAFVLYDGV